MSVRHEKIDTRGLLNGEAGDANYVDPRTRLAERARVLDYWPEDLTRQIRDGFLVAPPWRLLLDPTGWDDVDMNEVYGYVRAKLTLGRWPSIDELHRKFGRISNHRSGAENPDQEALL